MVMLNKNKLLGKIAEAGYSQRSLAPELRMSKNTLNGKINGKTPFNINEIDDLCQKLGIISNTEKADIFLYQPSLNRDEASREVG